MQVMRDGRHAGVSSEFVASQGMKSCAVAALQCWSSLSAGCLPQARREILSQEAYFHSLSSWRSEMLVCLARNKAKARCFEQPISCDLESFEMCSDPPPHGKTYMAPTPRRSTADGWPVSATCPSTTASLHSTLAP